MKISQPAVPFQDLYPANRLIEKPFLAAAKKLYRESAFSGGPYVARFEASFARYLGARHCLGVNSGTSAVHLALEALGVGPGDEVIVPAFTFVGSAWGILYCGAKPVFADIDPESACLDPKSVSASITPRTKAIIAVHLFGRPAAMTALLAIAKKARVALIEDVAQAHGARIGGMGEKIGKAGIGGTGGKAAGTFGDIGCFSFYPSKNLGAAGEGGAVVTDNARLADRMAQLRNHGQKERYRHDIVGWNYRMDGLQGLFLDLKLPYLDEMNAARGRIAQAYLRGIRNPLVLPLPGSPDSVWHLFVCRVRRREAFLRHLDAQGIGHGIHYPIAVPDLKPFQAFGKPVRKKSAPGKPAARTLDARLLEASMLAGYPNSRALADTAVSLPLYFGMTPAQIRRVIAAVNAFA